LALPFFLNNKITIAITLTVADESEDKGAECGRCDESPDADSRVDLQYKKHISVILSFIL
jgi:hypothetical protein